MRPATPRLCSSANPASGSGDPAECLPRHCCRSDTAPFLELGQCIQTRLRKVTSNSLKGSTRAYRPLRSKSGEFLTKNCGSIFHAQRALTAGRWVRQDVQTLRKRMDREAAEVRKKYTDTIHSATGALLRIAAWSLKGHLPILVRLTRQMQPGTTPSLSSTAYPSNWGGAVPTIALNSPKSRASISKICNKSEVNFGLGRFI